MSTILDDLVSSITKDFSIRSVPVGVHWTVVCSRSCGLAATRALSNTHGQEQVRDVGRLHQKSVRELAELAYSTQPLEAAIGVAAIRAGGG